ncbi:MAG: PQQ-binding-like beta-propeller repeat protein [Acidobacteriota bacterium]
MSATEALSSNPAATEPPTQRRLPRWIAVFWGVAALLIAFLSLYEVNGDPGVSNLLRFLLGNLTVIVSLAWFLTTSRFAARTRLTVFAVLAGCLALFLAFYRVEGVRGDLAFFNFSSRWGAPAWDALDAPATSARTVDLERQTPYDFTGFQGSNRDGLVTGVRLAHGRLAEAPETLWRQPIGGGWSGFAVVNGFAATVEQRDATELVTLYDVDTGALIWSHVLEEGDAFASVVAGKGPRSTPAIADGVVYAVSVYGKLVALDGSSGSPVWERDLSSDQGLTREREKQLFAYGRAGSPLVVGDRVVVPLGGDPAGGPIASVAAYSRADGELYWSGGTQLFNMASPQWLDLGGVEQIAMVNEGSINGYDMESGRELWGLEWPGRTSGDSSVSQARAVGDDRLFVSKGYGHGAALYEMRLNREDGTFAPEPVWQSSRVLRTKFTNVVFRGDQIYGLSEGVLECVDLATGERVWKHGRYGHGQILLVDDVLVVLTEEGEVVFVEATPERRDNVLGRFQAIEGQTWNTFAIAGDRLLVRNAQEAAAFRLPLEG